MKHLHVNVALLNLQTTLNCIIIYAIIIRKSIFRLFRFFFVFFAVFSFIFSLSISFTTLRKSILWTKIISQSKQSITFSRLSRLTIIITYNFFISFSTFSHSLILQFFKSINNITKRFFITRFKTLYFTIKNLYIKFYDKFKSTSFIIIKNRLFIAFFFRIRTLYALSSNTYYFILQINWQ